MINELKAKGWEVDVIHERRYDLIPKLNGIKKQVRARGGRTLVIMTNHNRQVISGIAVCADEDNYCKRTGRLIAMARALVQIPEFRDKVPNLFVR